MKTDHQSQKHPAKNQASDAANPKPVFAVTGIPKVDDVLTKLCDGFQGNDAPFAIINGENDKPAVVFLMFDCDDDKYKAYEEVSKLAASAKATSVTLVSDVWVSNEQNFRSYGRPSKDPNRTEALSIVVVNPKGAVVKSAFFPYTRNGKEIVWGPPMGPDSNGACEHRQSLLRSWSDEGTHWFAVAFNDGKVIQLLAHSRSDAIVRAKAFLVTHKLKAEVIATVDLNDTVPPPEERNCLIDLLDPKTNLQTGKRGGTQAASIPEAA